MTLSMAARGRLGALQRYKLYGNPGTAEGRSKGGKTTVKLFQKNPDLAKSSGFTVRKDIASPKKSENLAEFIGAMLGDGSLRSKYQCTLSFNHQTDLKYAQYIQQLLKSLFLLESFICFSKKHAGADIVVSSCSLIDFFNKQGIPLGNKVKNQVAVPAWIYRNLRYRVACLRGLMDTDGGVYLHSYKAGGKSYSYLKICFTNCSEPLLAFVLETLSLLNIKAYLKGYHVSIYSRFDVKEYFKSVGTSNPKHLNRFNIYF